MIFTFYSFKGGVGRSMALANVAELLYERGLRVLMVDFDLEAPGLERYFGQRSAEKPNEVRGKRGVIDLVLAFQELRAYAAEQTGQSAASADIPFSTEPIRNFVVPIYVDPAHPGSLELLPAGHRRDPDFAAYAKRVLSLDWTEFYLRHGGEGFFDWFRQELGGWDVALIDSRTGVTELGGVCTHHLADCVLSFVATNEQNLEGTAMMAQSLASPELISARGRPLPLMFVPSRVEVSSEEDKHDQFAARFNDQLGKYFPAELTPDKSWFVDLKLQYVPAYSYLERVAVREGDRASKVELIEAYGRLTLRMAQIAGSGALYNAYHRTEARETQQRQISNVPPKNPFFVGRESELTRLKALLTSERRPVVITGIGGIGKTCLALEYAARGRQDYTAMLWARAGSPTELEQGLEAIAFALGTQFKEPWEVSARAQETLQWLKDNDDWLLILDGVEDVRAVLHSMPGPLNGDIICTSRVRRFEYQAMTLQVEPFSIEESRIFLERRLGRTHLDASEQRGAEEMTIEFGGLPLALEQAAAQIVRRNSRVEDFFASYRKRRLGLLHQQHALSAGRELSVATVFDSAFVDLEPFPAAKALLFVSAWLAPNDIPFELLQLGAPMLGEELATLVDSFDDPILLDDVLEPLVSLSMITRHGTARTFSVNRILQQVTRARTDHDASLWQTRAFHAAALAFNAAIDRDWTTADRLAPQVAAILREPPLPALAHDQIVLQLQLAEYFFFRQRWEDAEALFEASLQSTVGAVNDAVMVFATSRLADLKVMKGDLEGADRLLSDVREKASALPVGHQWAAFMSTVARVAYERNRTDDAARTWLEVVSHGAVLTPSQQVDALLGLSGIALERGDWSEADTLMLKALSLSTPLGPRAVASALRLASAFAARARGRGHELRAVGPELQQSLLNAARHVSSDADLAALLARLGEFILIRSDAVTAERLLRRALEIQRRTLPSADPMLAETLRHLAMAIATLGNRHEAVVLLRESIEITTAVYGPNSPEIAGLRSVVESLSQTTQS